MTLVPRRLRPRPAATVVLRATVIAKSYGRLSTPCAGVDFDIRAGEVTVLLGENGAGKSTLMKIMAGVERPTSGHLELDGELIALKSTVDAAERGIAIIHQELSLCPNLSVRDNIFLGREMTQGPAVRRRRRRGVGDDSADAATGGASTAPDDRRRPPPRPATDRRDRRLSPARRGC